MTGSVPPLGMHLIAEFHGCSGVDDAEFVQAEMVEAAIASGATVLRADIHSFGDSFGVTGVVLLAESHISIHTWPEYDYAAIDIFVCGSRANPQTALNRLQASFKARQVDITRVERGNNIAMPATMAAGV